MKPPQGPRLLSIGLATPPGSINQSDAASVACDLAGLASDERRRIEIMHRRSGIEQRGTVLIDPAAGKSGALIPFYQSGTVPTTAQRLRLYEIKASELAVRAASGALSRADILPARITHFVTASCTGASSPGFDLDLVDALPLGAGVARTHVGFMGCHAAINALRVAGAIAAADAEACVLVCCVELCSLHFDASQRPDAMIANALFADGAAACVIGGDHSRGDAVDDVRGRNAPLAHPRLLATASHVVPGTRDLMSWRIGDRGFEMTLSATVPAVVREHLRPWLSERLGELGLTIDGVRGWAVHPGGPRVLESVDAALSLPPEALDASRNILKHHGNMSSATVLFILDALLQRGDALPAVLLAFGPGITIEMAVFA
jgi:predicted naringenin-chalcone synthase